MKNNPNQLLKEWCDGLLRYLVRHQDPRLDGALVCPACLHVHGRSDNAVYPLLYLAEQTQKERYLAAAQRIFLWHEDTLCCDDGSTYNDIGNAWSGITVFSASGLYEALTGFGSLLTPSVKQKMEHRLSVMAAWLYNNLTIEYPSNINYQSTNAFAMAAAGTYFHKDAYLARAKELAEYALCHLTENGLLFGEGSPRDIVTPRGCRAIDIGYNVEESIPALVKYAFLTQRENLKKRMQTVLHQQLAFLLPDGAWDNSFGSRNNKWTYWGSRTSDGCAGAYAMYCGIDPVLAEAARRNVDLLAACTHDGLLCGGPHYALHGEPACLHHTICHAVALTDALRAGLGNQQDRPQQDQSADLPTDLDGVSAVHYPEIDTWKITVGPWRATVTGYDYNLSAGHVSGGTLSLLWHKALGPVLAASVMDYRLNEPLNMQLTLQKKSHRPLAARAECYHEGTRYAQCYDTGAEITCSVEQDRVCVSVQASLVALGGKADNSSPSVTLHYDLHESQLVLSGRFSDPVPHGAAFVLPIIAQSTKVHCETTVASKEEIFFLTGGFCATEYVILPDESGSFRVVVQA